MFCRLIDKKAFIKKCKRLIKFFNGRREGRIDSVMMYEFFLGLNLKAFKLF